MGHGFTITCRHCGYEKQIHLGIGFMYYSLESVMEMLPRSERKRLKDTLKKHFPIEAIGYDFAAYENKLYVCTQCGEFSDDLHVRIKDPLSKKIIYRTRHTCRKCKSRMKQIGETIFTRYPCPRCKKMTLTQGLQMMWD